MTDADDLAAVVERVAGRQLDDLDVADALDVAQQLRAIADALPGPGAAQLNEGADLVERRAGID